MWALWGLCNGVVTKDLKGRKGTRHTSPVVGLANVDVVLRPWWRGRGRLERELPPRETRKSEKIASLRSSMVQLSFSIVRDGAEVRGSVGDLLGGIGVVV